MFEEFAHVRIKRNGVTGIIVDISKGTRECIYTVESDTKRVPDPENAYPSEWPLYDCTADELEIIE